MMKEYSVCMSVAGSDPSGGAGLQADLKTFTLLACYGQAVPTALTVQNSLGVRDSVPVDAELVYRQIACAMQDLMPHAVKIGMLPNAAVAKAVAEALRRFRPAFVVLDPVMISSSGRRLVDEEAVEAMDKELMSLCTLVTPNIPEAVALSGNPDGTPKEWAGMLSDKWGGVAVLVKGGHAAGRPVDVLFADGLHTFESDRVETPNTHGTGCVLSSAIAALTTRGYGLPAAVEGAKKFLTNALRKGGDYHAGAGHGAMYLLPADL